MKKENKDKYSNSDLFYELKKSVALLDPVSFAESYLTLDGGNAFDLSNSGWRYMAEVYRTIYAQVDSKDGKPVILLKGRQVGATIMAGALSLHMASSGLYGSEAGKPPIRIVHAFPDIKRCSTYSKDILASLISGSTDSFVQSRGLKFSGVSGTEDALSKKNFIGMNTIRIDSTGKTADRIRGSTQDVLIMDEVQDMTQTAIENSIKILQSSPYGAETQGVQLFFGTPKFAGSYFWNLWRASDQRFYYLRCVHCDHYFKLYNLEDDSWNDIWQTGHIIKCPECSRVQDKNQASDRGKWVAENPEGESIGYHFNMMLFPKYTKEHVLKYWPKHNPNASERFWANETLGKFYSASSASISFEDIYNNALDTNRGPISKVNSTNGSKFYFLGMDWGDKPETDDPIEAKRGKSYTCALILSVDSTGQLSIENAAKLKKNDVAYKTNAVRELMNDFKITQAVVDLYHGHDMVDILKVQEGLGDKFIGCINHGSVSNAYNFNKNTGVITVNKDMVLDELFTKLKTGKIKLPGKGNSDEKFHWLIEHICSMQTEVKVKDGINIRTFQKGVVQNDGLMALMYAYIAYKFTSTRGFMASKDVKNVSPAPLPVLGYVPMLR